MENQIPSKKHQIELSVERDFGTATPVRYRYCLLSTQRCGSTLVGRVLHKTQLAGDPLEYFEPTLLNSQRILQNAPDLSLIDFVRMMEKRRTSPNGYFGIKMHYHQWLQAYGATSPTEHATSLIRQQNAVIWIRRRDKIGQAISLAIAQHSGVWSSEASGGAGNLGVSSFNPAQLTRYLSWVVNDDFGWEQFLGKTGIPFLEVWYEDLISDYAGQIQRLCQYLNIDGFLNDIPRPPIRQQASPLNDELRQMFLKSLG